MRTNPSLFTLAISAVLVVPMAAGAEAPLRIDLICKRMEQQMERGIKTQKDLQELERTLGTSCSIQQPRERLKVTAGVHRRTRRAQRTIPVASRDAAIRKHYVEDLLAKHGISGNRWKIKSFTADKAGNNVAFLLNHPTGGFAVYKNSQKVLAGATPVTNDPVVFRFTDDERLLHAVEQDSLYLDAEQLTRSDSDYNFGRSSVAAVEDGNSIAYPEKSSVWVKDLVTGTDQHFDHPGTEVQILKRNGNDVYYTLKEDGGYYLYKNGKKVSDRMLSNPWAFTVSDRGVLFMIDDGECYRVIRGKGSLVAHQMGKGGFLFEDAEGNAWHLGYKDVGREIKGVGFDSKRVYIYKNDERITDLDYANVEGAMAFAGDNFALRVALGTQPQPYFSWPPQWHLLKNGNIVGDPFTFSLDHRDFSGPQFGANGKVYLRNYDQNEERWKIYEDGKAILGDSFANVFFFAPHGSNVHVYGTKR